MFFLVTFSLFLSSRKNKVGILKIKNQRATKILIRLTSSTSLTSKNVNAINKASKPPTNPKPHANPETLPTFFSFDKSIKYELQKTKSDC